MISIFLWFFHDKRHQNMRPKKPNPINQIAVARTNHWG